jgi:hypothetical protein
MDIKKLPKVASKYSCEKCDYNTCKKSSYTKHLMSSKHIFPQNDSKMVVQENEKLLSKTYGCECGKIYKYDSGYYRHKKTCVFENPETKSDDNLKKKTEDLINYLIKENAEFKQLIIDQNRQMFDLAKIAGHHNNNTTNNNFNLQFFLNETCKDALNIMDFVNQLQIGIKDLEETGRLGFVEGISKIFINGLKDIDVNNRPVHCSVSKREIIYIKNDDEWHKETDDKVILTNALKHVVNKNMKQIPEWTKEHPEYNEYISKENDKYLKIVSQSMPGSTKEETNKNYNKIIKNIAKQTIIDK